MKKLLLILTGMSLFLPSPSPASWFDSGSDSGSTVYSSLTNMTDEMAKELKNGGHAGKTIYLDREDIHDDQDSSAVSCLNGLLSNELERALSRAGFALEGRYADKADLALSVNYNKTAEKVTLYVKVKLLRTGSVYRNLKGSYELPASKLPEGCFADTLDSRITRLSTKVARGWQRAGELNVFVRPVVDARKKYSSPFSEYVTRKIKTILPAEQTLKIIEEKPAMEKLAATRSIAKHGATIETSDAAVAGADAVAEGTYLRGSSTVSLALTLKNLQGVVLASAEEPIPLSLIQYSLENDDAEKLSQIADTEHEKSGGVVRMGTSKGGNYQIYRDGEVVKFNVQVTRPVYLYIYDINPKGEVNMLFPKAGEAEIPRTPGIIYQIPEESDSWEIKVEPPYGADAVKVFASDRKLPVPTFSQDAPTFSFTGDTRGLVRVNKITAGLARKKIINGYDLVDYYKATAKKMGATLFESTVYVETRAK